MVSLHDAASFAAAAFWASASATFRVCLAPNVETDGFMLLCAELLFPCVIMQLGDFLVFNCSCSGSQFWTIFLNLWLLMSIACCWCCRCALYWLSKVVWCRVSERWLESWASHQMHFMRVRPSCDVCHAECNVILYWFPHFISVFQDYVKELFFVAWSPTWDWQQGHVDPLLKEPSADQGSRRLDSSSNVCRQVQQHRNAYIPWPPKATAALFTGSCMYSEVARSSRFNVSELLQEDGGTTECVEDDSVIATVGRNHGYSRRALCISENVTSKSASNIAFLGMCYPEGDTWKGRHHFTFDLNLHIAVLGCTVCWCSLTKGAFGWWCANGCDDLDCTSLERGLAVTNISMLYEHLQCFVRFVYMLKMVLGACLVMLWVLLLSKLPAF